jgi:hypothetical protein
LNKVPTMNELSSRQSSVLLRLILYEGEVYRLPYFSQGIRVQSGRAWITFDGQDIVLDRGEKMWAPFRKDFALASALGETPLILEILGDPDRRGPFFSRSLKPVPSH